MRQARNSISPFGSNCISCEIHHDSLHGEQFYGKYCNHKAMKRRFGQSEVKMNFIVPSVVHLIFLMACLKRLPKGVSRHEFDSPVKKEGHSYEIAIFLSNYF